MAYGLPSHGVTRKDGMAMKAGDREASKASGVRDEGTQEEARTSIECAAEVEWLPTLLCATRALGGFLTIPNAKN